MRLSNKPHYVLAGTLLSALLAVAALQNATAEDNPVSTETSAQATPQKMSLSEPTLQRALPQSYYSDAPRTDEELTSLIKEQLSLENGVDMNKITLQTVNGVVMLTGTATNKAIVDRIIQIARSAGSVKWVESTISAEM